MNSHFNVYTFLGTDKNAGKTTALTYIYKQFPKDSNTIISSIGIGGESIDFYSQTTKPTVVIRAGDFAITAREHLQSHLGLYEVITLFTPPAFEKEYICIRASIDLPLILEGPNTKEELLKLKKVCGDYFSKGSLLIDGSVDRTFLASPEIAAKVYLAIIINRDITTTIRAQNYLTFLTLPQCTKNFKELILKNTKADTHTLLFDRETLIYQSSTTSMYDYHLEKIIKEKRKEKLTLFIKGPLSYHLSDLTQTIPSIHTIVHDATSLHTLINKQHSIAVDRYSILNSTEIQQIFINLDKVDDHSLKIPENIKTTNIYKDSFL